MNENNSKKNNELRTEITVKLPKNNIIISLEPMINLVIHTLNLYNLLGHHGGGYLLKDNDTCINAVDSLIYDNIAGRERYFTTHGDLNIYSPTLCKIISENLFCIYPSNEILDKLSPEPFNKALIKMWNEFYSTYWRDHFDTLLSEFNEMAKNIDWINTLKLMESLTECEMQNDMYVFVVEATGYSALKYRDNVCIGTLDKDSDAGFVHEGLHLLLQEKWAECKQINEFMAERKFEDSFWKSWKSKYEQALVVALDICIQKDRYNIEQYFDGCKVGDLQEIVFPHIKSYYEKRNRKLEDVMFDIICAAESKKCT